MQVTTRVLNRLRGLSWWQQVLLLALASLCYIHVAGWAGVYLLAPRIGPGAEGISPARGRPEAGSPAGLFARWDSGYYLTVAEKGYSAGGPERAFFPLYPTLARAISQITGLPLLWSGWLVSITCFVLACLLLYRWVLEDHAGEIAWRGTVWLCCFPVAFIFVAFYPESLYLVTALAAIYMARRGHFFASGLAIAVAGASRPQAFLLAVPYFLEFWLQRDFSAGRWLRLAGGATVAPLGMLGHLYRMARLSGRADWWRAASSGISGTWSTHWAWPWVTLRDGVFAALFGTGIPTYWFSRLVVWQDLGYALLGLFAAVWGFSRVRLSTAAFTVASMLFFFADHGPYGYAFWSMPRRIATLFPVYLVLALATSRLPARLRWALWAGSLLLLGLSAAWFTRGGWVT